MIFSRDKGTSQKDDFADFRALIEKFPSWKEKVTSRAEPSWKLFSSSPGSSQLGSGSSLVFIHDFFQAYSLSNIP